MAWDVHLSCTAFFFIKVEPIMSGKTEGLKCARRGWVVRGLVVACAVAAQGSGALGATIDWNGIFKRCSACSTAAPVFKEMDRSRDHPPLSTAT